MMKKPGFDRVVTSAERVVRRFSLLQPDFRLLFLYSTYGLSEMNQIHNLSFGQDVNKCLVFVTRVTRRVSVLVEQYLTVYLYGAHEFTSIFSGVRVTRSLVNTSNVL